RDFHVTGVQTCALPICTRKAARRARTRPSLPANTRASLGTRLEPGLDALHPGLSRGEARTAATHRFGALQDLVVRLVEIERLAEIGRAACRGRGWVQEG